MRVVKASYLIQKPDIHNPEVVQEIYKDIESAGRTCYVSWNSADEDSARKFVKRIVQEGHEAMLEHAHMRVLFTVDRGVSHEAVRHRIASFAQESTRYCNYSKDKFGNEIAVIEPIFFEGEGAFQKMGEWMLAMQDAEKHYFALLKLGATPQEARTVLPTSLKTSLVLTASMREWRHIFKLRAAGLTGAPHPQMVEVMLPLLRECRECMPELFGDIPDPD